MRFKLTGKVFGFLVLGVLSLVSCQRENIQLQAHDSHPVEVGFYAGGTPTRTEMLDDGLRTVWSNNDTLSLWAKNSAGDFTLNKQNFITYGLEGSYGFFSSILPSAIEEGTYTYYCSYPVPFEVNGTKATFNIPSVQDGKASGGADVMISYPKIHGALTPVPEPENHSGMSLTMKRLMHQFRFYIPSSNTVVGDETLERIVLTFPSGVVSKATWDIENPDAAPVPSESVTTAELRLSEPLGVSGQTKSYACFAFVPQQFSQGQVLKVKAYTRDKIAYIDDIDLCARDFQAGHSTPVRLNVKEIADYPYRITFYVSQNNLGENVNEITLWDEDDTELYSYKPGYQFSTGETFTLRFEDEAQYRAFGGKNIKVTFDSDHALTSQSVRIPDLSSVNVTMVTLQVPYLLYQDFNSIATYSDGHDNPGVGGTASDTYKGINDFGSIDLQDWYGARVGIKSGAARICCRYEHVILAGAYYKGRIYSSRFSALKEDVDVNISVSFDYGGDRSERTYNAGSIIRPNYVYPQKSPMLYFGINSEEEVTNPDQSDGDIIDSITGMVTGTGFSNSIPTSLRPMVIQGQNLNIDASYTNVPNKIVDQKIENVDRNMRLGWIVSTDMSVSNTHANYWLYVDNIKVQITK